MVDHTQSDIPHESKFGDEWKERLYKSSALSPFRPISDLVDFVAEESHRLMEGTAHEEDWVFWYDSLSFFTSKECCSYMKSTEYHGMSIYNRWLKPLNGLNAKTIYQDKYVCNSPEFMPLDNCLNYDLQLSHRYHCIVIAHLPDSDERKFSLSTPLLISKGFENSGR